jgi:hypothetical protein
MMQPALSAEVATQHHLSGRRETIKNCVVHATHDHPRRAFAKRSMDINA